MSDSSAPAPSRPAPGPARAPQRLRPPGRSLRPALQLAGVFLLAALALPALGGCIPGDEFTSEGNASSPVPLSFPVSARTSTVGGLSSSYYSVGVAEGATYTVSITELTQDAMLWVYTDAAFSSPGCSAWSSGASSQTCSYPDAVSSGITTLYIKVSCFSDTGTDFLLSVQ
jgi:hypothetical protein